MSVNGVVHRVVPLTVRTSCSGCWAVWTDVRALRADDPPAGSRACGGDLAGSGIHAQRLLLRPRVGREADHSLAGSGPAGHLVDRVRNGDVLAGLCVDHHHRGPQHRSVDRAQVDHPAVEHRRVQVDPGRRSAGGGPMLPADPTGRGVNRLDRQGSAVERVHDHRIADCHGLAKWPRGTLGPQQVTPATGVRRGIGRCRYGG